MTKIRPPNDASNAQQWQTFLEKSAYRGYKVNRLAVKLEKEEIGAIDYLRVRSVIQASSSITGLMTRIFLDKIKNRFWLPRWNHERKMKNENSSYAKDFHERMGKLAAKLAELNQKKF